MVPTFLRLIFSRAVWDFKQVFLFRRQDQGRVKKQNRNHPVVTVSYLLAGGLSLEFLKIIFKPDSGKKEYKLATIKKEEHGRKEIGRGGIQVGNFKSEQPGLRLSSTNGFCHKTMPVPEK